MAEHAANGAISLGAFWIRRARRLFPALLLLLVAVAIYARWFVAPDELARIRGDALATFAYVANWRMVWSEKSYWELFSSPSPLEHTWSLAIEEQFYVVWPLLVMLALRLGGKQRRVLFVMTLLLGCASVAAMLVLYQPLKTGRVYLGTDTRASGILAGALLAMMMVNTPALRRALSPRLLDGAGIVSLLGLGFAWWTMRGHDRFLYRGGFWLTEIAALILILCAVQRTPIVNRILAFAPLRFVGTISYGLYLWHWPVNVVVTSELLNGASWVALTAVRFGVTFAIAIVSYRFLERPIRERGIWRARIIAPAATLVVLLAIVGGAAHAQPPKVVTDERSPPPTLPSGETPASTDSTTAFKVLVFGDSTAVSLGWTMRGVQRPNVDIALLGRSGCTMLYDTCYGETWVNEVHTRKPNAAVLILGGAFQHEMEANGRVIQACHPEWNAKFEKVLGDRLHELVTAGATTTTPMRVHIVTLPLGLKWSGGKEIDAQIACINRSIRKLATTAVPAVNVIDLAERVCPKGKCILREPNAPHDLRPDGLHYDMEGSRGVSAWLLDELGATQSF